MDATQTINRLKGLLVGKWAGEGFAKFPTIDDTAYTEQTEFKPDEYKDSIFFSQKTWYKNETPKNGHTVFWDTGFILLRDEHILLHSVQVGGRIEQYRLSESGDDRFVFDSSAILVDPKAIRSQRVFTISTDAIDYELNMATHQAPEFQNHLKAHLRRTA
jgi:THAP4-like, heme-binding beta-barrel domain